MIGCGQMRAVEAAELMNGVGAHCLPQLPVTAPSDLLV